MVSGAFSRFFPDYFIAFSAHLSRILIQRQITSQENQKWTKNGQKMDKKMEKFEYYRSQAIILHLHRQQAEGFDQLTTFAY